MQRRRWRRRMERRREVETSRRWRRVERRREVETS